jgi:transketolase
VIEAQPNRVIYGKTLVELGEANSRVIVFDADIAKSTNTYRFGERFPDRFFNMGVAELNMVCMAAGASTTGLIPFVSTFGVFASMRACEGVRTSICYPRLNVKIVATNAGVEIAGDGVTHQAVEDLAIMRSMANLTVLSPSDPVTTRKATLAIAEFFGPVYMRLGRQVANVIHSESTPFQIGKMIRLRDGNDLAIIATGNMVEQALLAAESLAKDGIHARVLDCHTIKPIDVEEIRLAAEQTGGIVTAEDHNVIGGLGGAVCEVVAETHPTIVKRVGLVDCFASSGRDYRKLLSHYGLDARQIIVAAREVLKASKPSGGL